jgi:hypothetical protein
MFPTSESSYSRVSVQSVKLPCDVASGGSLGEDGVSGAFLLSAASWLCIGKADGELSQKLLAFFRVSCFFALMLVGQVLPFFRVSVNPLLLRTYARRSSSSSHHRPQRGAVLRLSQACYLVRFVDENAQLLDLFIATAVSLIPLTHRLCLCSPASPTFEI